MKTVFLAGALVLATAVISSSAQADFIEQRLMREQGCQNASTLTISLRDAIEQYVGNAEALIEPPAPVGDLGCLDQLMQTDIAFQIQVPDIQNMFAQAVSGAKQRLCQFAQDKWNEVTAPLQEAMQLADFTQNFDLFNIPELGSSGGVFSGRGSGGGSGGSGGAAGSGGGSNGGSSGGLLMGNTGEALTAEQLLNAWRQINGLQNTELTPDQIEAFRDSLVDGAGENQANLDQSVIDAIREQEQLRRTWELISGNR